jgi:VIT1/CCC1 family predicted Fe2+/Mn2+ transporter
VIAEPARVGPARPDVDRSADAEVLARRAAQVTRGGARAAVLGVSDGLVSNICLILGVAGADASASSVRLAGFASLLAGALSMAAGEWVSVRSQVDLYSGLIGELRSLVDRDPELVLDEVVHRLETAGFGRRTARLASTELPLDEPRFLHFTAANLFGVNADELGSPMTAALSSLVLFAAGAFVPLLPWLFTHGGAATVLSIALTAVASIGVGAVVSQLSGKVLWRGGARQFLIVVFASAVTYGVGKVFGATIG